MRKKTKAFADRADADRGAPNEAHLKILGAIRRIPRGFVCTYGKVAEAAGLPRRARMVGQVLRISPLADNVPWHRVVNASGRISDRGGEGPGRQGRRLAAEGVEIDSHGIIDFRAYLWHFKKRREARAGDAGRKPPTHR